MSPNLGNIAFGIIHLLHRFVGVAQIPSKASIQELWAFTRPGAGGPKTSEDSRKSMFGPEAQGLDKICVWWQK